MRVLLALCHSSFTVLSRMSPRSSAGTSQVMIAALNDFAPVSTLLCTCQEVTFLKGSMPVEESLCCLCSHLIVIVIHPSVLSLNSSENGSWQCERSQRTKVDMQPSIAVKRRTCSFLCEVIYPLFDSILLPAHFLYTSTSNSHSWGGMAEQTCKTQSHHCILQAIWKWFASNVCKHAEMAAKSSRLHQIFGPGGKVL